MLYLNTMSSTPQTENATGPKDISVYQRVHSIQQQYFHPGNLLMMSMAPSGGKGTGDIEPSCSEKTLLLGRVCMPTLRHVSGFCIARIELGIRHRQGGAAQKNSCSLGNSPSHPSHRCCVTISVPFEARFATITGRIMEP